MKFLKFTGLLAPAFIVLGLVDASLNPRDSAVAQASVDHNSKLRSERPDLKVGPFSPRISPPQSPARNRTCSVDSHNDGITDDSSSILDAINACNYGGHVIFTAGINYTIGTALNLTFLNSIDIDIQGNIKFTNDTTYWQANSFRLVFQNATTFLQIGGNDVVVYGGGEIDGNGQVWYDLYAKDIYTLRPTLLGPMGLHNSTISNLNLRYSPCYYFFISNSSNVIFDGITIGGYSTSNNIARNTDGFDTYRSSDISIQNSIVNNGDDCVSFKPNSSNIFVQNIYCNGSHGISVGSLGQYVGTYDIISHVYVYNISFNNAADGARIKVWPGSPAAVSGDLQGGGGSGEVSNITYDTISVSNTRYAIEVDQCYGQRNLTQCLAYPSNVTISDVLFKHITGTTNNQYQPQIAAIACSSEGACDNIVAQDISVLSANGTNEAFCLNVNQTLLEGIACVNTSLGFN